MLEKFRTPETWGKFTRPSAFANQMCGLHKFVFALNELESEWAENNRLTLRGRPIMLLLRAEVAIDIFLLFIDGTIAESVAGCTAILARRCGQSPVDLAVLATGVCDKQKPTKLLAMQT